MENIKDALETALEMEKKGYDIYMKAAAKTSNKLGKTTLESIAAKEKDHMKAIEQFEANNTKEAIISINPQDKVDYVKPIMERLEKELDEKVKPDSDLKEAYRVALGLEKASFDYYKNQSSITKDPQTKKFFQFLMGEENTHYELLQETMEYLDDPKDWFREQERWIVEG